MWMTKKSGLFRHGRDNSRINKAGNSDGKNLRGTGSRSL